MAESVCSANALYIRASAIPVTMSADKAPAEQPVTNQEDTSAKSKEPNMNNILEHIKRLETSKQQLEKDLHEQKTRNEKLSQKTREGMQSALDTLMTKWMDAVNTKDDKVKTDFKQGLEKLVHNSAEDNGVWQMMVAASSLHQRQEHDLDELNKRNKELQLQLDGMYGSNASRVVGEKDKTREQGSASEVAPDVDDIWAGFGEIRY